MRCRIYFHSLKFIPMSEFEMFCIFVSKGYRIYSGYSSLLFLMLNTFEMSSIIHANKYCKMT